LPHFLGHVTLIAIGFLICSQKDTIIIAIADPVSCLQSAADPFVHQSIKILTHYSGILELLLYT
jgi:hypothetical protein